MVLDMPTYSGTSNSAGVIQAKRARTKLRKIKLVVGNIPGRTILTRPYPVDDGKFYELPTYTIKASGTDENGTPREQSWEVFRFGIYNNDGGEPHYTSRGLFVAGLAEAQRYTIGKYDPTYKVHSAVSMETGAWQVKDGFLIHDGPDIPATATNPIESGVYASIGCIEVCGTRAGFDRFNTIIRLLSGSLKKGTEALIEIGAAKIIEIEYLAAARPPLKEHVGTINWRKYGISGSY